jgi:protein gp37
MGNNSKIEWCDHTFNPWIGCTKVSPGCEHCYAEAWAKRSGLVKFGPHERKRTSEANWQKPIQWNRQAERLGIRSRVFCASLADVFDEAAPDEWRADLFALIRATPNLDWLLLTKRIGNADRMFFDTLRDAPLPSNLWMGATVCNQEEAERDIPLLIKNPASLLFVSLEPLLGPIDISRWLLPTCDRGSIPCDGGGVTCVRCGGVGCHNAVSWVISGGESGPHARPMHPDWVRSIRDQCKLAGVPFLFKQHGEWLATAFCDDKTIEIPYRCTVYVRQDGSFYDDSQGVDFFHGDEETAWIGKKAAGRLLGGVLHDEYPGVK